MGLIGTTDNRPVATLRRVHGRNVYRQRREGGGPQRNIVGKKKFDLLAAAHLMFEHQVGLTGSYIVPNRLPITHR